MGDDIALKDAEFVKKLLLAADGSPREYMTRTLLKKAASRITRLRAELDAMIAERSKP